MGVLVNFTRKGHFKWSLMIMAFFTAIHPNRAQQQGESVVQLDKPYYVAGEVINYQVYLPNSFNNLQPIFEALIYDGNGLLVDKTFLRKKRLNSVSGYYKIPYEIDPGIYQLIINAPEQNGNGHVSIARALLPTFGISDATDRPDPAENPETISDMAWSENELKVSISLPDRITTRTPVEIEIVVTDRDGNPVKAQGAVSITDSGIIGSDNSHHYQTLYSTPVKMESSVYLTEDILVSGRLDNREEGKLLTFYMPSVNRLQYTTTGSNGNFQLLLPEFYDSQNVRYIGQFSDGARINIDPGKNVNGTSELLYSSAIINYLEQAEKRRTVYQLFNKTERNGQFIIPETVNQAQPDKAYDAKSYPFPNLPSFCRGLSTQLKYIKDKEQGFLFKMFNAESRRFYFGNPLFIIDGQITKDVEYLAQIDFGLLDQIWLYYDDQRLSENFGFAGYGGVVIIFSKDGNLLVPESKDSQDFIIKGIQPEAVPVDTLSLTENEPRFNPQLLWNPLLETDDQGKMSFAYLQSDDVSTFRIEILLQDEEGRRVVESVEYHVSR